MQSTLLIMTYSNNSRHLKKIITELLYKWIAQNIHKINYSKSYKIVNWKLEIQEEKIILVQTSNNNYAKLIQILKEKWFNFIEKIDTLNNELTKDLLIN